MIFRPLQWFFLRFQLNSEPSSELDKHTALPTTGRQAKMAAAEAENPRRLGLNLNLNVQPHVSTYHWPRTETADDDTCRSKGGCTDDDDDDDANENGDVHGHLDVDEDDNNDDDDDEDDMDMEMDMDMDMEYRRDEEGSVEDEQDILEMQVNYIAGDGDGGDGRCAMEDGSRERCKFENSNNP